MMRGTIFGIALASVLLVGCGGGGSSDTAGNTNPSTLFYSCLTKTDTAITNRCATSCNEGEITFDNSYYSVESCEESTGALIATHSKVGDTPKNANLQGGFDYLNSLRIGMGLHPLRYNSLLEKASGNHELYVEDVDKKYNVWASHYEYEADYPSEYYTGYAPWDRAEYVGYTRDATEVLSSGNSSATWSIAKLMTAIYHRHALIGIMFDEFGSGGTENDRVFAFPHLLGYESGSNSDFLRAISPEIVVYPYSNETNVSTKYSGGENPEPLEGSGLSVSGNPISFIMNEHYFDSTNASVISFKLYDKTDGDKEITETLLLDVNSDPHKRFDWNEYALFPKQPLEAGHTYRVEVKYQNKDEVKSKEWEFVTRG